MPSESRGPDVTVSLPPELAQWLDERASDLDVDRETVLLQLLSSYQAAEDLGDDIARLEGGDDIVSDEEIESAVKGILTDRLPDLTDVVTEKVDDRLRETLAEDLRADLTAEITEQVNADLRESITGDLRDEVTEAVRTDLDTDGNLADRVDELEAAYREDLDDVREKVIRVKRDANSKAPKGHAHEEFETITELTERLDAVETRTDRLRRRADQHADLGEHVEELSTDIADVESILVDLQDTVDEIDPDRVDTMESDLDDAQEKLTTVAYVVRDLRDAVSEGGTSAQVLDRIKQQAAQEDISRAHCENCGEGVEIGLLTDPSCPHCDATVGGVEPSTRRFGLGTATLTTAAGLESGVADDPGDELDDIETDQAGDHR